MELVKLDVNCFSRGRVTYGNGEKNGSDLSAAI
jgi:hypothetical protein